MGQNRHQITGLAGLLGFFGALAAIDSAGLGVLVSCLRRTAAEGGDLRLAGVPVLPPSVPEEAAAAAGTLAGNRTQISG